MKWLLVVLVFGTTPIRTDLVFDTLDECLQSEDQMRTASAETYDAWLAWADANPAESGVPDSRRFMRSRLGVDNTGTCIPHPT